MTPAGRGHPRGGFTFRDLNVGLSPEAKLARRHSIGGSDANIIAGGDDHDIHRLWLEKTGRIAPQDLSSELAVMMGVWTEELNRWWFERQTGLEVRPSPTITSTAHDWLTASPDGLTHDYDGRPALFEAKHTGAFGFDAAALIARYSPQLHHTMFVAEVDHAVLSVFVGTQRWEHYWIEFDPFYHHRLLGLERAFWQAVVTGAVPNESSGIAMPVRSEQDWIDMTGSQQWATAAAEYLSTRERNRQASQTLRRMVPKTAKAAGGHGVAVRRDTRGSLRVASDETRDENGNRSDRQGAG